MEPPTKVDYRVPWMILRGKDSKVLPGHWGTIEEFSDVISRRRATETVTPGGPFTAWVVCSTCREGAPMKEYVHAKQWGHPLKIPVQMCCHRCRTPLYATYVFSSLEVSEGPKM
jgi:hypothetical protein